MLHSSNAMSNGRFLSRGVRLARCSCSDFLSKSLINLTARMTKLDLEATRTPTVNEPSMGVKYLIIAGVKYFRRWHRPTATIQR